jgi:formate hydrogenlyase transcriptional activator
VPIELSHTVIGGIALHSLTRERIWPHHLENRLRLVGELLFKAMAHQEAELKVVALQKRLESENLYLREEINLQHHHGEIIGQSRAIRSILKQVEQVAPAQTTVLITCETGTGKELVARAIHGLSRHRQRAMIRVNCASLPSNLVESELFGREKGAYTGALTSQAGRFELAHGSTIFLDEISELPLELQAKLLRVLQEGEFERLGSTKTMKVKVRVVTATNRDLEQAIQDGRFRQDLYYRLNVFPINIPPLRQRREDIPQLVWAFVQEFSEKMGKTVETIPGRVMERLKAADWPGNVRELRNVIERAMILTSGPEFQVALPQTTSSKPGEESLTLSEVERKHIVQVLEAAGWRVSGKGGAAERLGLKPTTLNARMAKLGIRRP